MQTLLHGQSDVGSGTKIRLKGPPPMEDSSTISQEDSQKVEHSKLMWAEIENITQMLIPG